MNLNYALDLGNGVVIPVDLLLAFDAVPFGGLFQCKLCLAIMPEGDLHYHLTHLCDNVHRELVRFF